VTKEELAEVAARADVPALVAEIRRLWALRQVPCGRCGQLLDRVSRPTTRQSEPVSFDPDDEPVV